MKILESRYGLFRAGGLTVLLGHIIQRHIPEFGLKVRIESVLKFLKKIDRDTGGLSGTSGID